jgi:hypothetical protein
MKLSEFIRMVKNEIINEIFGLNKISEDQLPGDDEIDVNDKETDPELNPPQPEQPETQPEEPPQPDQPQVKRITKLEAVDVILGTKGRVFTVLFTKRTTGQDRLMNCRLGVKKFLTGKGLRFDPNERALLPVWDMQKRAYRMISMDAVKMVKANGLTYDVTD